MYLSLKFTRKFPFISRKRSFLIRKSTLSRYSVTGFSISPVIMSRFVIPVIPDQEVKPSKRRESVNCSSYTGNDEWISGDCLLSDIIDLYVY